MSAPDPQPKDPIILALRAENDFPNSEVAIAKIEAQSSTVKMAFLTLIALVIVGILAIVETTGAGLIGLIAGLYIRDK